MTHDSKELLALADRYDAKALAANFSDQTLIYATVAKDIRAFAAAPQPGMRAEGEAKQLAARLIGYVQARPEYSFDLLLMHVSEAISMFVRDLPAASPAEADYVPDDQVELGFGAYTKRRTAPPKSAPDAMREAARNLVRNASSIIHTDAVGHRFQNVFEFDLKALAAALSAPVPPPDGAADFPRFLGSSSENGSPRIARCVFAADLSNEDHRKIATALINRASPPSDDVRSALEHAEVRFRCLVDHFKEAGEEALQAMSDVDYERMRKGLAALRSAPVSTPAITVAAMEQAAQICRDKYCEIMPGKRTWAELTKQEREIDIVCLAAAFRSLSAPGEPTREQLELALTEIATWCATFGKAPLEPVIDFIKRVSAPAETPDFETAALALGFQKRQQDGKWFHPNQQHFVKRHDTAADIFDWYFYKHWGERIAAAPAVGVTREAIQFVERRTATSDTAQGRHEATIILKELRSYSPVPDATVSEPVAWADREGRERPIDAVAMKMLQENPTTKTYWERFDIPLYTSPQHVGRDATVDRSTWQWDKVAEAAYERAKLSDAAATAKLRSAFRVI